MVEPARGFWDDTPCRCYVQYLPQETRYVLHCGAHNKKCPHWQRSRDPVDDAHDTEFRDAHEADVMESVFQTRFGS